MSRVKVKICGIRSFEEARLALELGVDAVGFNFWKGSRRYMEPDVAARIIGRIKDPFAAFVGVFVNEAEDVLHKVCSGVGLTAVQLHGDESVEYCRSLSEKLGAVRIIKAVRVGSEFDPASVAAYPAAAILLDTHVAASYGGTGQSFDWSNAIKAKAFAPIILAGGITAYNVAEAIQSVTPAGIDVCSGVESEPGRKNPEKMKALMQAVELATSSVAATRAGI